MSGPLKYHEGELAVQKRAGAFDPADLDGNGRVGRLEEQRLVHRRTDSRDRRVARVEITSQGRRLLAQSRSRKTAYLERQLAALTADERDTLERAAEILERVLEKERS